MSIFQDFPRGVPGRSDRNAPLGTAQWSFAAPAYEPGHFWLGYDATGKEVGYRDDRHIVTVAGSRAGKGYTCIIPNLRRWPGSCVVVDPKGENASKTATDRADFPGHEVAVLDPRGAANVPDSLRISFNPLDLIDPEDDDAIDLVAAIGDAVMIGSGDGKDVHWTESARDLLESLMLHVAVSETGERRSLVRVRQLLTMGDADGAKRLNAALGPDETPFGPFDALWSEMANNTAANEAVHDLIAGAALSITDMGDNERGSVLSTARRNTKFIASPFMRKSLRGGTYPSLDIDRLKTSPNGLTVYVCLSARFISTHARFLRLVLNLMLYRMEAQGLDEPACGHPVLFVMDEFAALGRLEVIEKAAGLMAGYGIKLWTVLQDLGQLKRHYKESWETFLANAGILQFFANSDMTTLEWISKRLGQKEVIRETSGSSQTTNTSTSKSQGRSEQAGWSRSSGTSEGNQAMADLSRLATQSGGSGLVPFLARAKASSTARSEGTSLQEGQSGGETIQSGDSVSSGSSATETSNEGIHLTPLMTPDEVARIFDRAGLRQIACVGNTTTTLFRYRPLKI